MIYTVTFSPAIDYVVYMDELIQGATNRTKREEYFFGGKGINVSTILTELGIENTALGFVSGFTGEALEKGLKEKGIHNNFVHLDDGITRINIKIKTERETEINAQGPKISKDKIRELLDKLYALREGDILVISGNIPNTLPEDIYQRILERLDGRGSKYVIDATGELLKKVLKYRPFFIKPNNDEMEELLGYPVKTDEDLRMGAEALQKMGAKNILVSLGKNGAYLLCEDGTEHKMKAVCNESAVNTVGAGDSMVAGFLAGYLESHSFDEALRLGIAAGSATACSEGLATEEKIKEFYNKL